MIKRYTACYAVGIVINLAAVGAICCGFRIYCIVVVQLT